MESTQEVSFPESSGSSLQISSHVIPATLLEILLVYIEWDELSQSIDFSTCLMLVLRLALVFRLALADASAETLTRGNQVSSVFYV